MEQLLLRQWLHEAGATRHEITWLVFRADGCHRHSETELCQTATAATNAWACVREAAQDAACYQAPEMACLR